MNLVVLNVLKGVGVDKVLNRTHFLIPNKVDLKEYSKFKVQKRLETENKIEVKKISTTLHF